MRAGPDIHTRGNNQEQDRRSRGRKCRETEETRGRAFKIREEKTPDHDTSSAGRSPAIAFKTLCGNNCETVETLLDSMK